MKRKTKRALKAVNCIMEYLVTEEMSCSNTEWKDKDGYSFHTDIGYFDQGLIEFKEMLERKLAEKLK